MCPRMQTAGSRDIFIPLLFIPFSYSLLPFSYPLLPLHIHSYLLITSLSIIHHPILPSTTSCYTFIPLQYTLAFSGNSEQSIKQLSRQQLWHLHCPLYSGTKYDLIVADLV